jgi:hypothetical protein
MPVNLQSLHKRVVDGHDVGRDDIVVAFEVSDHQPLVVQAVYTENLIRIDYVTETPNVSAR